MNVQDYIKVYENIVSDELCDQLMDAKFDYKSSSFSSHKEVHKNSKDRRKYYKRSPYKVYIVIFVEINFVLLVLIFVKLTNKLPG